MKKMAVLKFLTAVALLQGSLSSYAEALERKVDCSLNFESFVNVLTVDLVEKDSVGIKIENWSDYYQYEGLKFGGSTAAKATIVFPKSSCIIREKTLTQPFLMACSPGLPAIGHQHPPLVKAELTSLNGTRHIVMLDINAMLGLEQTVTTSVFGSKNILSFKSSGLLNADDNASVVFEIARSCK